MSPSQPQTVLLRAAPFVAALLAFGLRAYHLGDQSLWYDEAYSVDLAGRGLIEAARLTAIDTQPPLYYWLLYVWVQLTGDGEFAVRFLSLVFGVLAVLLLYVFARDLIGRRAAVVAALFASLSPVHVHYSQEARMYMLATTLALLSACALVRALREDRPGERAQQAAPLPRCALVRALREDRALAWAGFAVAGLLALYSHYYSAFVLAAEGLFALLWIAFGLRRRRVHFVRLAVAVLAIVLGYAPWLSVPLTQFNAIHSYYPGSMDFARVTRETLETLTLGRYGDPTQVATASRAVAALAALGWLVLVGRAVLTRGAPHSKVGMAALLLTLYVLVPIALLVLVLTQRPKFGPQQLLFVWPASQVLVVAGLLAPLRLGHRFGVGLAGLLGAALLGTTLFFLDNYYHAPRPGYDDWRTVARFVQGQQQPGDAVLLLAGYAAPAFRYYYGATGWQAVHPYPVTNLDEVVDFNEARQVLSGLAGTRRVWLVLWQDEVTDPNGLIVGSLDRSGSQVALARDFGPIRVRRHDLPAGASFASVAGPPVPLDLTFGGEMQLVGYDLPKTVVPAGEKANLTLYWSALRALEDDYHIAVRVVDAAGREWGRENKRPASYLYYTARWKPGNLVPGEVSLPVLPGTPPGTYTLQVNLFSITTMKSVAILKDGIPSGMFATLGKVDVASPATPPSYAALGLSKAEPREAGQGIRLLGTLLPATEVAAGGQLDLHTFWEVGQAPRGDLLLRLRLLDGSGAEIARQEERPAGAGYPTNRWGEGERLRGQLEVGIPATAGGPVRVVGRLVDVATGLPAGEELPLAEVKVAGRPHNTTRAPEPTVAQQARLGDAIRLLGYDLEPSRTRAGDTLRLRLYWQATAEPGKSYKVFTHLLDGTQRIWAQEDGIPGRGSLPTSSWIAGEYVADEYLLPVKPDAPPGEYQVKIGMYEELSGERLPVLADGGRPAGDHVILREPVTVVAR